MMIVPEPGAASGGVVSIGDDEAAPDRAPPASANETKPGAASTRQGTPVVHLQHSNLHSRYTGDIGHDFESPALSPRAFAKKEAPKIARTAPPKAAPRLISVPRNLDVKGIPEKDIFVPSLLHPEIVPEEPFWSYERKRKAVVAGLIFFTGVFYLMFSLGFFNSLVAKPRYEDEPGP